MDVRLPDGTIVRGVPENISKAELVAKLQRNGMQVPPEWLQQQGSGNAAAENPAPASQPSKAPGGSLNDRLLRGIANAGAGALRGAGSIGATLLAPVDAAARALNDGKPVEIGGVPVLGIERRQAMTDALGSLGADTNSLAFGAGKLGAEIAGTAGAGGALGNALSRFAPSAGNAIAALNTGGFSAGNAGGRGAAALRSVAGGAVGGAAAGLVNPEATDVAIGAGIGAALPPAIRFAGGAGAAIRGAVNGGSAKGSLLAQTAGLSNEQVGQVVAALKAAPDEIVAGGRLTLSQAMQQQGLSIPQVRLLERIVAGGPGGDELLRSYDAQTAARIEALRKNGAQMYMGAAKEEANNAGNRIGAVLRTQANDESRSARQAWEALSAQAAADGVQVRLPLDELKQAATALGPGTVGAGKDARAILAEATRAGTVELPAIKASRGSRNETLLQAVKAAGGIRQSSVSAQLLGGEVKALRQQGLGRVVYKDRGKPLSHMAEKMHEAGFIPDDDPATLIDALSAGGLNVSRFADESASYAAAADAAAGGVPAAERVPVAVPFDVFQRLRRSAGELGANPNLSPTEAGVLARMQEAMSSKVDDVAAGNLRGDEFMPEPFRMAYGAARDMTRTNAERYKAGNAIEQILRKPVGQNYKLTGDEITSKLWHGGAGLVDDVAALRSVLSDSNREPALNALRQFVMTDAGSKTTASGGLGAALPAYVSSRMPALRELLTPAQMNALESVAFDIRNAEQAAAVAGIRGSDTQAKISRALDAGLLDSTVAKTLSRALSVKGIGLDGLRNKAAAAVIEHKGKTLAQLFADPKAAAAALESAQFVQKLEGVSGQEAVSRLRLAAARSTPVMGAALASQQ